MGQLNLKDPLTLTHAHTPKKKKKRTSDEGEADKHQSLLQQLENPSVNFGSSKPMPVTSLLLGSNSNSPKSKSPSCLANS